MHRQVGDVRPEQLDRSLGRRVETRDRVEQRRLAGTVRSDEPDDLALAYLERRGVDRGESAELHGDVVREQHRIAVKAGRQLDLGRGARHIGQPVDRLALALRDLFLDVDEFDLGRFECGRERIRDGGAHRPPAGRLVHRGRGVTSADRGGAGGRCAFGGAGGAGYVAPLAPVEESLPPRRAQSSNTVYDAAPTEARREAGQARWQTGKTRRERQQNEREQQGRHDVEQTVERGDLVEQLTEKREDDASGHGTAEAVEAADNSDRQEEQRELRVEGGPGCDLEVCDRKIATHAGEEPGHGEGHQLVHRDRDAEARCGHLAALDREPGAAGLRAAKVRRSE